LSLSSKFWKTLERVFLFGALHHKLQMSNWPGNFVLYFVCFCSTLFINLFLLTLSVAISSYFALSFTQDAPHFLDSQ
jgi:hypothetical protein